MGQTPNQVTVSAGGVVLNSQGMVLLVNQRENTWSFPKGHIEAGEEALEAAKREIQEETGLNQIHLVEFLGIYGRFKIGKNSPEDRSEWKVIIFFLFTTQETSLSPQDPHHPEARWVAADQVESLLTHPKDKNFYKNIRPRL